MTASLDRLVYMANQIATAFRCHDKAVAATFDHIWHFWDPRMRQQIIAHLEAGGAGLNATARAAIEQLAHAVHAPQPVTGGSDFTHPGDADVASDAG